MIQLENHGLVLVGDTFGSEEDRPVLLLHGGGQTRHSWDKAGMVLAESGYFAAAVDLRGHGDSGWSPEGDYSMEAFAGDVHALAQLFRHPPVLVGASIGGLASLVAVAQDETVASALVLVDVAPRVEYAGRVRHQAFMRQGMEGFDRLGDAAEAISAFLPQRKRPSNLSGLKKNLRQRADGRWYWHWDPKFLYDGQPISEQPVRVDHEKLREAARRIRIPALLIRGKISDIVSDESSRELAELIPGASVVQVADAGHMVAGDRNDIFNNAVIDFIRGLVPIGG